MYTPLTSICTIRTQIKRVLQIPFKCVVECTTNHRRSNENKATKVLFESNAHMRKVEGFLADSLCNNNHSMMMVACTSSPVTFVVCIIGMDEGWVVDDLSLHQSSGEVAFSK